MINIGDIHIDDNDDAYIYTDSGWKFYTSMSLKNNFVNEKKILEKQIKELESIIKNNNILFE